MLKWNYCYSFVFTLKQSNMIYKNRSQSKKETGLSYLGKVNNSTKHEKAYKFEELVYTLYLSPGNLSGYEVCPMRNKYCTKVCLHESGHNKMDIHENKINKSRIKKTKMFFEDREFFVRWMIDEIKHSYEQSKKWGYHFSVRLNNTSDINPESFYIDDNGTKKNILQLFPDVQFYDYTKVPNRVKLLQKYPNYDLTFSYDGTNLNTCLDMLRNNIRVAMVFNEVPENFVNHKVINGDNYDMRYRDETNVIVGLKFKKVRNKLTEDNPFVIQ